jgi:DNA-binding FadR family transcriptional regulator
LVLPIAQTNLTSSPPSTVDGVFEAILSDIVAGTYPPASRLPAERDLARAVGASRASVREALRRLAAWGLVEPRRGSGVAIRPMREWSIEVLPAYLRGARPPSPERWIDDLLATRRALILAILERVADRIPARGLAAARAAARDALQARPPAIFAERDLQVIRAVIEAAGAMPAAWMLHRVAAVTVEIAGWIPGGLGPPDDYLSTQGAILDALESGDRRRALAGMKSHLERQDERLLAAVKDFARTRG